MDGLFDVPDRARQGVALIAGWGALAAAGLVAAIMFLHVLQAPQIAYLDHWILIQDTMTALSMGDFAYLAERHNEHFLVVPKLAYALIVALFGTGTLAFSLAAWAIALAVFGALILALAQRPEERPSLDFVSFAVLAAVMAVAAFPGHAIHSFFFGFSGIAWFSATCLAVLALVATGAGRAPLGVALALIATFSYGTGLALWPAMAVTAYARTRDWRSLVLPVIVFVGFVGLFAQGHVSAHGLAFDPLLVLKRFFGQLGAVFVAAGPLAALAGAFLFGAIGWVSVRHGLIGRRIPPVWLGILSFGLIATLMMVASRQFATGHAWEVPSRLMSPTVLYAAAGGAAFVYAFGRNGLVLSLTGAAALAAFIAGNTKVDLHYHFKREHLAFREIATRLAPAFGLRMTFNRHAARPARLAYYQANAHYPFNAGYDRDCGLAGKQLPADAVFRPATPDRVRGRAYGSDILWRNGATGLIGWALPTAGKAVRCVLFVEAGGRVTGYALAGLPAYIHPLGPSVPNGAVWRGLSARPVDGATKILVRLAGDPVFYELPRGPYFGKTLDILRGTPRRPATLPQSPCGFSSQTGTFPGRLLCAR